MNVMSCVFYSSQEPQIKGGMHRLLLKEHEKGFLFLP